MKKKNFDLSRSEQGQSMVIVAMVFVGLAAFAGLAIDGGNLFVQRRQAQNAADASALAGTRLVSQAIQSCSPINMPALDAEIDRTINDYAEQNGVSDTNGVAGDEVNDNVIGYYVDKDGTPLGQVGETGALPLNTSGVFVEIEDTHETFFLPVAGIKELPSSAQAMALTGVVNQFPGGAGLLPIAVPEIVVDQLEEAENKDWEMHDNLDGEFCYTDAGGTEYCIEDPGAPHNAQRGWLNLNHIFNNQYLGSADPVNRTFEQSASMDKCPSDPSKLPGLPGYASGLCPYKYPIIAGTSDYLDGDFIHGTSGAASVGVKAVYDSFAGQTVFAPVFDRAYLREEMVDLFDPQAASPAGYSNGGGFSSAGGGGGSAYYYHIVGYVAAKIGTKKDNHVVRGTFQYTEVGPGAIDPTGYTGTCTSLLHGINLWE